MGCDRSVDSIFDRLRDQTERLVTDEQLEQMGLWYIVTMHEPIKDSGGGPLLLDSGRSDGGRWLDADYGGPGGGWGDDGGFAFAVPQLSSFLSLFLGRVLFCKLTIPSTEHLSNLIKHHREGDIFFVIKRFCFPENH